MGRSKLLVVLLSNHRQFCTILLPMLVWPLLFSLGSVLSHLVHLVFVAVCRVLFWVWCELFSKGDLHGSSGPLLLEPPLVWECRLLMVIAVHCLAVVPCLLPSPLVSLASSRCISSSVMLVIVVVGWMLFVLCLWCLVMQLVALVVLCSAWPWTMFLLSKLCWVSSFACCGQGCEVAPQGLRLFRHVCVRLSSCSPRVCPLGLDIVDLACMLLFDLLCEVSPNILGCCRSKCRVDVSPIVFLLVSMWWVILLLWFLVVTRVRPVCSLMVFLWCSQAGSMFLPFFSVLLQIRLDVWLLVVHWDVLRNLVLSVLLPTEWVVKPSTHRMGSQFVGCSRLSCRPICIHRLWWDLLLLFSGLASHVLVSHMFVLSRQTRLGRHVLLLHCRS